MLPAEVVETDSEPVPSISVALVLSQIAGVFFDNLQFGIEVLSWRLVRCNRGMLHKEALGTADEMPPHQSQSHGEIHILYAAQSAIEPA